MSWPACSIAEATAKLTAPGAPFAMREEQIAGQKLRTYVGAPSTMRQVIDESRAYGERDFLVYGDERISFEAHWRAVQTLGRALATEFGIEKGDRVAVAMRNFPEWSACAFAAMAIGAIFVPLNAWESGPNLASMIHRSGARVVFVDRERRDRIVDLASDVRLITVRADDDPGSIETIIGKPADWAVLPDDPAPDRGLAPDDPVTISFTSGTTGMAKGALATHRMVLTNLVNTQFRVARAAVRRGEDWPPAPAASQQTVLLPLPLFHVTGLHSALVPALARGNRLVMMYRWDLPKAIELIARHKVNILILVPTLVVQLLEHLPEGGRSDLQSVHTVTYGGSPAAADLAEGVVSRFPGAAPAQGYGATETSSLVASNSHEDLLLRPRSVGTPVPCCDIRIVDEAERDVPDGEPGELWVRGPQVFAGYWNQPEATAETLKDGWYRTGDIVRRDEEGFLYVLDRKKDMVIRGGENVYCSEVEAAIGRIPGVLECAVFGLPDRVLGETVAAWVVTRGEMTASTLGERLATSLAGFKIPSDIRVSREPLPRNAAGKVLKRQLRDAILAERESSGSEAIEG